MKNAEKNFDKKNVGIFDDISCDYNNQLFLSSYSLLKNNTSLPTSNTL